MQTNFYFFKVSMVYVPKNRLHQEFQEYVQEKDRTVLIGLKSKNTFLRELKQKLKELNAAHHRCKPVELSGYSFTEKGKQHLRVDSNFTADIFEAEQILKHI